MNMKRNLLTLAMLSAIGATGTASAVHLSETGAGQVLLYPYYTVEGNNETLLSVVNTTARTKAVKVRFREAKNSQEVLDFNLYLSPFDVWTGAVVTSTNGGAKIITSDTSCTVPAIPAAGVNFRSTLYNGDAVDDDTIQRTREGYVEIIQMGDVDPDFDLSDGGAMVDAIAHVGSGANRKPGDCAQLVADWTGTDNAGTASYFATTPGELDTYTTGLIGAGTIINTAKGTDYTYEPTTLDGFSLVALVHSYPGSEAPTLADAEPVADVHYQDPVGVVGNVRSVWLSNVDAVSSVLMRSAVMNEYTVNNEYNGDTDWVVTFPTKHFYVPEDGAAPTLPFHDTLAANGSCEDVALVPYGREEEHPGTQSGTVDFSPLPAEDQGAPNRLCWEANVVTFDRTGNVGTAGSVLSSNRTVPVTLDVANVWPGDVVPTEGWLKMTFLGNDLDSSGTYAGAELPTLTPLAPAMTFTGLPVIGFAVQQYVDTAANATIIGNYGGSYAHKYERNLNGYTYP